MAFGRRIGQVNLLVGIDHEGICYKEAKLQEPGSVSELALASAGDSGATSEQIMLAVLRDVVTEIGPLSGDDLKKKMPEVGVVDALVLWIAAAAMVDPSYSFKWTCRCSKDGRTVLDLVRASPPQPAEAVKDEEGNSIADPKRDAQEADLAAWNRMMDRRRTSIDAMIKANEDGNLTADALESMLYRFVSADVDGKTLLCGASNKITADLADCKHTGPEDARPEKTFTLKTGRQIVLGHSRLMDQPEFKGKSAIDELFLRRMRGLQVEEAGPVVRLKTPLSEAGVRLANSTTLEQLSMRERNEVRQLCEAWPGDEDFVLDVKVPFTCKRCKAEGVAVMDPAEPDFFLRVDQVKPG